MNECIASNGIKKINWNSSCDRKFNHSESGSD